MAPPAAAATTAGPAHRVSSLVWWGVSALVLVVVAVVLLLHSGQDVGPEPATTPTGHHTPLPVDPGAPAEPTVTASREGRIVIFAWHQSDRARSGDSWEWRRPDTGEQQRTSTARLRVTSPHRVCLQVRLVRDGSASPWSSACVR